MRAARRVLVALLLVVSIWYFSGGPVAAYYTAYDHQGSKAWERRSFSTLDEGDHHAKVCDHNPFYKERVVVGVRGRNIVKTDPDGIGGRCGNIRFGREGWWHKTCSVNQCGGTSQHRKRR